MTGRGFYIHLQVSTGREGEIKSFKNNSPMDQAGQTNALYSNRLLGAPGSIRHPAV